MPPNPNRAAAGALVEELWRSGVTDACISPGSRSTALVLALVRCPGIRRWTVTDERAGGFFALGVARETRRPVVLVCTSGTAGANYLPAVAEAAQAGVPLIVLTADRPAELRDCGASQTIDQVRLFGSRARWSVDLAAPASDVDLEPYYRAVACRAFARAAEEQGPVHLNLPMREPLLDVSEELELSEPTSAGSRTPQHPWVTVHATGRVPSQETIASLAARLGGLERGLLVCGPGAGERGAAPAVAELATALGWPILADPLSGLRFGRHDRSLVVDAYDVLLRDPGFCHARGAQAVVQLGRLPASKPLERFLAAQPRALHLLVASPPAWPDPLHRATDVVQADAAPLCALLAGRVAGKRGAWADSWLAASRAARAAIEGLLAEERGPFEGKIFPVLERLLPDGAALHVGNSMPVRDADTFLGGSDKQLDVFANRGANGIDGVVATALGGAAVRRAPSALVVGDLSFLHDLGALQIAARHAIPLVVVLVHNDGGGIFSFLPQAALGDVFEPCFATPHGLDPEGAVKMCAGRYTRTTSWEELALAVTRGLGEGGLEVIALASDRAANAARHREIVAAVLDRVRAGAGAEGRR